LHSKVFLVATILVPVACLSASRLDGRWELIELKANGNALPLEVMDRVPMIELDSGRVTGDTGCNQFETNYELSGSTMSFHGGSFENAGCGMVEEQPIENAFTSAVREEVEVSVRGQTMVWHTADDLELTFSSAP
jgi:heat shock protein HslJ